MKKTHKKITYDDPYKLKESVEKTFDTAELVFNKQEGFHTMLFVDFEWMKAGLPGGVVDTGQEGIAIVFGDEDMVSARRDIIASLGAAAATLEHLGIVGKPTRIRLASEVWMSESIDEEAYKNGTLPPPSEDPNRKEGLAVLGCDADGYSTQRMKLIRRYVDGLKKKNEVMKVKLEDIPKAKDWDEWSKEPNLLTDFWDAYLITFSAQESDTMKTYRQFTPEAQNEPKRFLSFVIDLAIKTGLEKYRAQNSF